MPFIAVFLAFQPAASAQPRTDASGERAPGSGGLLTQMTAFKTHVPAHPFSIVLGNPTSTSMTISVICDEPWEIYIEYRRSDSAALAKTPTQQAPAGEPVIFVLTTLAPNTEYTYRLMHRARATSAVKPSPDTPQHTPEAADAFTGGPYYAFHTQRPPTTESAGTSSDFTFTIIADSHLDANVTPSVYLRALANALADKPDFHIDLGDTFMTDKRPRDSYVQALPHYLAQRYYLAQLCHSAPLFMALGNHDGEAGYANRGTDNIATWSFAQRTRLFPSPVIAPSSPAAPASTPMYTGQTDMQQGQGANYYAFTWGDAQCIVLDPFWFTASRPRRGGTRSDRSDTANTDDNWTRTLGKTQYDWLTRTLESSTSRYTFVFVHHLVGGLGMANRGGVESSIFFEWGGKNADRSDGFAANRPGWAMPIHDLLAKHNVAAVFYGHDHLYVHAQRDGVTYQCVPQPGNTLGGTRSATDYGYASGKILASPGHLRVRVGPEAATVDFIRAATANPDAQDQPKDTGRRRRDAGAQEANAAVVARYELKPVKSR